MFTMFVQTYIALASSPPFFLASLMQKIETANIELKIRPKQLLGSLPLDIELPEKTQYS
jgi:hypothetical protein